MLQRIFSFRGKGGVVQKRGNSPVILVLLIALLFFLFILQLFLQGWRTQEKTPAIPEGGDLAIIGGTTAALLTAIEAAADGAQVFLFPNGHALGEDSTWLVEEGLAAASTPSQQEEGIEFTPEMLTAYLREEGGGVNDPLLLVSFRTAAANLVQKAAELGGVSFNLLPQPEQKPYLHFCPEPRGGALFRENLCQKMAGAGVVIRNEKVLGIATAPEGRVETLLLENTTGEITPFYVQAAVLADGGYSGDVYYRHTHLPRENLIILRPDQQGLGLRRAEEMGLDLVQMDFMETRLLLSTPADGKNIFLPPDLWPEAIYFNSKGRVLSGIETSLQEIVNLVLHSPADEAFILVSGGRAAAYEHCFREYATRGELEERGLPAAGFLAGRYLPGPPYYVAVLKAGVAHTLGGVAVTPRGEVKRGGEVVKGLYAAGEIVGGLHGERLIPGMALSETLFTAEMAGKSAAAYAGR